MPSRADLQPGELAARSRRPDDRGPGRARAELLAALADVRVEPDDYALIEQAKTLVDEVNRRLRARQSEMVYSITFCAARPLRPAEGATAEGRQP